MLWPNAAENSRDIVLSLGTGYSSNYAGDLKRDTALQKAAKPLGRKGLVEKLAMLRLVEQSTAACEDTWHEFRTSLSDDKHLLTKCHRINIPFGQGQSLCKLDDVTKVEATDAEAAAFLSETSRSCSSDIQTKVSAQLNTIARQLRASLFYYEVLDIFDLNEYKHRCMGRLRCRLDLSYKQQMRSLLGCNPRFRVHSDDNIEGTPIILSRQGWNPSDFSIPAPFETLKHVKDVRIEVSFNDGAHWDDISGFPRELKKP